MFGIPMLDVVIGLVFVYFLLSLICTTANEMLAGLRDSREKNLRAGITNLLGDHAGNSKGTSSGKAYNHPLTNMANNIVQEFYAHPMIKALHEDGTRPSYIPANVFSQVIVDLFVPADGTTIRSKTDFVNGVNKALLPNSDLQRTLLVMSSDAADMVQLRASIESWFNSSMDRVSAWYKNKSQGFVFAIALMISLACNADSIKIARDLYNNEPLRTAWLAQAQGYVASHKVDVATPKDNDQTFKEAVKQINTLGLSWGWGANWQSQLLSSLPGIILTALAISLGAPFWFDLLNKLVNIRAVGKPPAMEKTAEPANAQSSAQPAVPILPGGKG